MATATVTFDSQGGSAVTAQTVTIGVGGVAVAPTAPTFYGFGATGYTFGGWFTEYLCVNEWAFATLVTGNMTLYAKWNELVMVPYEVKTLLQISGTAKDTLISMLLPQVQDDVMTYCRNAFEDADGVLTWPEGIKIPVSQMIGVLMAENAGGGLSIGMQSETQGGYSYNRGSGPETKGESGYPISIEKKLSRWRLVGGAFAQKLQQFRDKRGIPFQDLAEGKAIPGVEGAPLGSTVYPRRWVAV